MISILALILLLAQTTSTQSALRVVVIEGEDAVNIIQQKTAVRPVVEVRDRNNLPVPGALVTFSIEGGKAATFGGASTLTVATNAAGQAAVTGLTPSAAGAFQIQVSAAFQGQVATATIAQTNVLTAAQAAAAGASSASGASSGSGAGGAGSGAAGGGGGLSATTIAVAGAAVAGGAVAATQIAGKVSEEKYTGQFSGQITGSFVSAFNTCTYIKSVTATASLRFKDHSDSSVRGQFEYEGTETIVSTTCAGGTLAAPQFIGQVDVSGSPSNFSGRNVFPGPPATVNGATITGEHVYTFQGSISGDAATGVFTYEENSLSTGGGGSDVRQLGTGSFTITFQKS
jgi:hypothetical protein